jgi:diadenosine tetraphosphatase ApaH/serine/threonine PP2A family protein phosphatase
LEHGLADAEGEWDKIWCLGDLIGYGPDPNECVALLRQHDHISLSGNHDWAVLGKLDANTFNHEARQAIDWTRAALTEETRDYLDALPTMRVDGAFTLAHASPRQPVWEYILDAHTAAINFDYFDTNYCLVGHTHVPIIFESQDPNTIVLHPPNYDGVIELNGMRVIINPGSVGQPRDSDPRAAYAILDLDEMTFEYRRVIYPVAETQARMRAAGMPSRLIKRLEFGW